MMIQDTCFGIWDFLECEDEYLPEFSCKKSNILRGATFASQFLNCDALYEKDLNILLNKAIKSHKKYCLIQMIGHFFFPAKSEDHTPHYWNNLEELNDFNSDLTDLLPQDFLVIGHIIDHGNINNKSLESSNNFGIHKQCFIINLKLYKELGSPEFGDPQSKPIAIIQPIRSQDNFHHFYTPKWVKPGNNTISTRPTCWGWNIINESFKQGLAVYNFNYNIRKYKKHLYHNENTYIRMFKEQHESTLNNIWYINTEDLRIVGRKKNICQFVAVSSGLKSNVILHTLDFLPSCKVVYFDMSKPTLEFKKYLINNWDGKNYPDFCIDYQTNNINNHPRFFGTDGLELHSSGGFYLSNLGINKLKNWWLKVIECFDGEYKFLLHWNQFKRLEFEYFQINLVQSYNKLPVSSGLNVVWVSNILDWWFANVYSTREKFLQCLQKHFSNSQKTIIYESNSLPYIAKSKSFKFL